MRVLACDRLEPQPAFVERNTQTGGLTDRLPSNSLLPLENGAAMRMFVVLVARISFVALTLISEMAEDFTFSWPSPWWDARSNSRPTDNTGEFVQV